MGFDCEIRQFERDCEIRLRLRGSTIRVSVSISQS